VFDCYGINGLTVSQYIETHVDGNTTELVLPQDLWGEDSFVQEITVKMESLRIKQIEVKFDYDQETNTEATYYLKDFVARIISECFEAIQYVNLKCFMWLLLSEAIEMFWKTNLKVNPVKVIREFNWKGDNSSFEVIISKPRRYYISIDKWNDTLENVITNWFDTFSEDAWGIDLNSWNTPMERLEAWINKVIDTFPIKGEDIEKYY
jgi:hypothetical protein